MSTPSDTPAPAPKSPLSSPVTLGSTHLGEAPKPAFKVTRSPFAPRISGQGGAGSPASSISMDISGAASMPPKPTFARKSASSSSGGDETSPALLLVDFICAAVAIAAAVMIWQHSR